MSHLGVERPLEHFVIQAMDVLVLTVFLSLVLAAGFICLFVRQRQAARFESLEREALLPLEEDGPPLKRFQPDP